MARLTWDNVAAPNFSGIADSYRVMSQLLGNATKSGLDMIDTVKNTNAEAADRAILQRIAGVQDPAQFDAASIIGGDGSNASLRTLGMVADRPEALLRNAVTREGLNWDQYGHQRTIDANAVLDAPENRDKVNQARSLAAIGRGGEAVSLLSSLGLRADQYANVLGDIDTMSTRALARDVTGQRLTEDRFDFGNKQQDDATRRAANQLAQTLWSQSYDGPSALRAFGRLTEGQDPRTVAAVRQVMSSIYPEFGFGGAGGGGGSGAAPSGSGVPNQGGNTALSTMTGGAALPQSIQTVGDMVNGKSALLGFNPKGTATGMYQITSDTWKQFGQQALGDNWESANIRDPQVQDKVAEAIWNSAKGSASGITGRWASVSPSQAASMVNKPWSEVRDTISRGETGTFAGQILSAVNPQTTNNLVRDVTRADDQANVGNVSERLAAHLGQRRPALDVAKEIVGNFEGATDTQVQRAIQNMMTKYNISADQAAELMLQNRPAMERNFLNPARWLAGKWDPDVDIAGRGGAQAVDSMLRTAASNENRATLVQNRKLVDGQILDREARINALNARIEALGGNPGLEAELKRVQTQRDQLKKVNEVLQSYQENNQNTTSGRVPTDEDRMVAQIQQYLQNRTVSNNGGPQDLDTMLKIAAMLPN